MQRILIQLDTDSHPSTFDRVVAVDAGVEHLFSYGNVSPENVTPLVHGAIFTRKDLRDTALFIGGSDVVQGETLLKTVGKTFFGPMRVSVMMDSNGSNTTAAAAVLATRKHLALKDAVAVVLPGTGPVGQRAAQLLAIEGAKVRLASRTLDKARRTAESICAAVPDADVTPFAAGTRGELESCCAGVRVIIAAGAAGAEVLPADLWSKLDLLTVIVDLNAVPPLGVGEVDARDKAVERHGKTCYGALAVGGLKMKIHKAAIKQLFESNDQVLDTVAIYRLGENV